MGRTLGAVCRRCRREGMKLFLKGTRCDSKQCPVQPGEKGVQSVPPGMHGARRSKVTDYAIHLREKQKVKAYYGVLEKQFRKYFGMAEHSKGNTGENLLILLERRLDNVVHRFGFATSRSQARQLVSHGHVLVNGRRVSVASFLVRPGDQIALKNRPASIKLGKEALEVAKVCPDFLVRNSGDVPSGTVMRDPVYDDVSVVVNPQLIVELCSR